MDNLESGSFDTTFRLLCASAYLGYSLMTTGHPRLSMSRYYYPPPLSPWHLRLGKEGWLPKLSHESVPPPSRPLLYDLCSEIRDSQIPPDQHTTIQHYYSTCLIKLKWIFANLNSRIRNQFYKTFLLVIFSVYFRSNKRPALVKHSIDKERLIFSNARQIIHRRLRRSRTSR